MNSIGRICIYVYISSNTRIYSISPEGFIQACVSVTLFQGGVEQKKRIYIYITLLQGGSKKMRRMWPMGTRSMPMPS